MLLPSKNFYYIFPLINVLLFSVYFSPIYAASPNSDSTTVQGNGQGIIKQSDQTHGNINGSMQACQAHQTIINNHLTQIKTLVNNMVTTFEGHAANVENYYTSKVVPTGQTVSNYDSLTLAITTQKLAVQTAYVKLTDDMDSFNCDSTTNDPKTTLTKIRMDTQVIKTALHNYRIAITNLITAIHSITGKIQSQNNSNSTGQ